jgi:hypothetical protein
MPQKTLVRKKSSPGDYEIVQSNQTHDKVKEPQKAEVASIIAVAERALKDVFDRSGDPSLASGVKLGLQELY